MSHILVRTSDKCYTCKRRESCVGVVGSELEQDFEGIICDVTVILRNCPDYEEDEKEKQRLLRIKQKE